MRHPGLAVVGLLALSVGACQASSDEAGSGSGPNPPPTGVGGDGGSGDSPVSLDDFGYAAERESPAVMAAAEPKDAAIATICGEFDVNAVSTLDRTPANPGALASPARARELIRSKQAPISASLRVDDHLNYYRIGAGTAPKPGELSTSVALRPLQIAAQAIPRRYELFVGLQAGPVVSRPPVTLTVLVDTTPSMAGEPWERARRALRALADALLVDDHLTVLTTDLGVVFDQQLLDPPVDTKDLEQKLTLTGETALRTPIEAALEKASAHTTSPRWNRVVVISDGQGDPHDLPLAKIAEMAGTGIRLNTVGVGGSYVTGDALLFEASYAGRGSYSYIDDLDEPDKMLRARFDQLFGVLYDAVQVTVTLPWFLESLDEVAQSTGASLAVPRAIAPDGVLTFVFSLEACHESAVLKYGAGYPIAVTTSYVNPADQQADGSSFSAPVSDLLKGSPVGLDEVLATRAYVSALKGPTKARFADAFAELAPLKQPGNAFEEMWSLLDAYPKKP